MLLLSFPLFGQKEGKEKDNFRFNVHFSTGINYTFELNTHIEGTYKQNSMPVLGGFDLMYKDKFGIEITSGYFPLVFYNNETRYQKTNVSINASLIAYPISTFLKLKIKDITFSVGGSLCILRSTISLSTSGTNVLNNSFGFTGAIAYQLTDIGGFTITPRFVYYHIPEVGSKTLSFQIRVLYNLFEF